MNIPRPVFIIPPFLLTLGLAAGLAQQPAQQAPPPPPMSFFVTSVAKGDGGNYGGLAGADAHCQMLAQGAGRGNVKWVAYLSTQGPGAVNARDRIGQGPWANAQGRVIAANLAELHGDNLEVARMGNRLNKNTALTEKGGIVKGVGDNPNEHDILTGSTPDGRAYTDNMDHTCSNYTSNVDGKGNVQVGHHDRIGNTNGSWNSAHASRGCSQKALPISGGNGYLYCFAPGN
jgi:hypothetical protein